MKKTARKVTSASEAREHCFVIMSYKPAYKPVFEQLRKLVEGHTGLRCIRADREMEPGRDLLGKVHEQILRASVVVADVSEYSPNVYYEYGYASAHDRLPILIARLGRRLPTDLVGKETLRYREQPARDAKFERDFLSCVDLQLRSPLPEQRRMIASPNPFPAFVIASPRVPGPGSKHWWHPAERQTFGDMLGITGILTAYGNLFGTRHLPELLHAQCLSSEVLKTPGNFFCIGSPKLNKATKHFLARIQRGLKPQWKMPLVGLGSDKRVIFKGKHALDGLLAAPVFKARDGTTSDYGLIIRAPYPTDATRLVLIVAGRHSIGTHAACMVVTRQNWIAALEERLKAVGVDLRDPTQPFWVVVRGAIDRKANFMNKVEIIEVGGYAAHASS